MKNSDLIKELQQYNPDADVTLVTSEDICISYICGEKCEEFNKSNTPIVFIESSDKYD